MAPMIMRPAEVCSALGISRTTLWRWCRSGRFPEPVQLGTRFTCWRASDVEAWLDATFESS